MPKHHWSQVARRASKTARTTDDGIVFDSAGERSRWHQLQLMERSGAIRELRRQVKFDLVLPDGRPIKIKSRGFPNGRRCAYHADFVYTTSTGEVMVEEYKGHDDPCSRLRRAVVEAIYDIAITVTGPGRR